MKGVFKMKQKNYDNCNGKEIESTSVSHDDKSIPLDDPSDEIAYYRKRAMKYLFHSQVYGLQKRK